MTGQSWLYGFLGVLSVLQKYYNFVFKNLRKYESFLKAVSFLNNIFSWLSMCAYYVQC